MTIYAFEAQESWLPTVIGMSCSGALIDRDEILRLHFGERREAEDGYLEAERTISMFGVWRIERGQEIVAASGDVEDPEREDNLNVLVDNTLHQVEVRRPGFDLSLLLSNELFVRCFPCDSHEYAEDSEEDEPVVVTWWVDGAGVPDDWEEPNEAFYEE